MNNLLITPKDHSSSIFLKRLLKSLDNVKEVREIKPAKQKKLPDPFLLLAENSLKDEWLSAEDDVWDIWAKEKLSKK